ncbi:tetratricopeptide repeat-containing sulfotransferase family protein [Sphingomonas profundi]|uniref:tetratricopeptide repeat-containing sulfotransferase family protein n=1 Tax=Alterirhizorhabdus profundi TaxID=2681549 RepID=UPI0012E71210|nr:sulfotransferase [Sphingomonas profundi]
MQDAQALHRAAGEALARGDAARARAAAAALVAQAPGQAAGHFLLGMAEAALGRVTIGLASVDRAIAVAPTPEHQAQRARLLILLRREADAQAAADAARAAGPGDALTFDTIGCVYARLGDHAAAAEMFAPAVAAAPDTLDFRYNLATALGFLGRVDEAEAAFEAILARWPGSARTHYALAGLRRQSAATNHLPRLEAALAQAQTADDRLRLRYALAKEYEDVGDAPAAFRHLHAANTRRKAEIGYDFAQDAAIFDAIEAAWAEPPPAGATDPAGAVAEAPIFVLGMPRTGTTLVDRILSSHPDVHSAGELQAMPLAAKQLAGTRSRVVIDAETVRIAARLDPRAIGAAYVARAGQHRRRADGRFIDKLPANSLYIGHIATALPHASIVCLRRDPMDVVWSNYKNLFAANSPYYYYSYDLLDTAHFYQRFDRLMAHWRRLFPGRVLELRYEDLVADQRGQTERLLAHCRLGWNEACLRFHENDAAVATPSAAQVRRPLYREAVARWKAHAEALEPVRAWFERQGIATG